jgi:hypothetical protein
MSITVSGRPCGVGSIADIPGKAVHGRRENIFAAMD